MHDVGKILVTNTTPIISLVAATGSLDVFKFLYSRVVVPFAVAQEVQAGGTHTDYAGSAQSASPARDLASA